MLDLPNNKNRYKLKKILLAQKIQAISEHLKQFIIETSNEELLPIIDDSRPFIRTGDMTPWMTSKKTLSIQYSHINNMVLDSKFEGQFCQELERLLKPYDF